jgi:peptidoglycan hydrolase CwlO-like protein
MINRITDGTINACDAMFDLIEQVRGVLPALIKAFEGRAEAPVDVTPMMQCAEALARGEQPVALDPAPAQIAAAAIVVDDSPASVSHDDVLSEEDMQQITEQFNSVASQLDVFQRSMNEMRASMQRVQSELAGLQQRPQTPATALEQINEDVVAAKTTIKSLQANLKAALTRLDGDNTDIRNSLSTLQSSESDMAALRAAMSAEFHALRMEQAEVGRAANTLATVAIAVGLACIGLILFFHMM